MNKSFFLFNFRLNAFLEGFYDIIPKRLISIFNEQELELLISGLPNVDIEDLKANTEYHKYQANSIQVWIQREISAHTHNEPDIFLNHFCCILKFRFNGSGVRCVVSIKPIVLNSCNLWRVLRKCRYKGLAHLKEWTGCKSSKSIVMIDQRNVFHRHTLGNAYDLRFLFWKFCSRYYVCYSFPHHLKYPY